MVNPKRATSVPFVLLAYLIAIAHDIRFQKPMQRVGIKEREK